MWFLCIYYSRIHLYRSDRGLHSILHTLASIVKQFRLFRYVCPRSMVAAVVIIECVLPKHEKVRAHWAVACMHRAGALTSRRSVAVVLCGPPCMFFLDSGKHQAQHDDMFLLIILISTG